MANKDLKNLQESGKQQFRIKDSTKLDDARLDQIAEAHQARIVEEIADLQEAIGFALETHEDLGVSAPEMEKAPGYDMPHEEILGDLPRHSGGEPHANASPSERGAARGDAAGLRPSGNPADWLGGMASGDAEVEKDPETGTVVKTWSVEHSNGSTTAWTSSFNPQTGTEAVTLNTTNPDRPEDAYYIQIVDEQDGSSSGITRVTRPDLTVSHTWARDSEGRMTLSLFETRDSSTGRLVNSWDRGNDPGFDRMPRDDAPSEAGRRFGKRFGHEKPAPAPEVTKVNPGDPDDSGPKGPRLQPGPGIAVNPPIDADHQSSRQMSAAAAAHWKKELLDRVGGKVNPPGPQEEG